VTYDVVIVGTNYAATPTWRQPSPSVTGGRTPDVGLRHTLVTVAGVGVLDLEPPPLPDAPSLRVAFPHSGFEYPMAYPFCPSTMRCSARSRAVGWTMDATVIEGVAALTER